MGHYVMSSRAEPGIYITKLGNDTNPFSSFAGPAICIFKERVQLYIVVPRGCPTDCPYTHAPLWWSI